MQYFPLGTNSQIDVVQSVGRVMRVAPGKSTATSSFRGHPAAVSLKKPWMKTNAFKVVWTVLNASCAHDDRFKPMVINSNLKKRPVAAMGGERFS